MGDLFDKIKKNKSKNKDLVRFVKNDNDVIQVYFNKSQALKAKTSYHYDLTQSFKLIGVKSNFFSKPKVFLIYEWAIADKDFVDIGDTLFDIIRVVDDTVMNALNQILLLPPVTTTVKGIVEILKSEHEELNENDLICRIHQRNVGDDYNSPDNDIFLGKFNKYEIPENIRNLNQITGKYIFLSQWLVENGSFVQKGEEIIEVKGGYFDKIFFIYKLKSKGSGIIESIKPATSLLMSDNLKQKEILYKIFKDKEVRFKHKYWNKPLIIVDEFNGSKIIKWEIVGGYLNPFNSLISNPIGGIISNSPCGKHLVFSFENHYGKDFLVIIFFKNEYDLNNGNKIYFMFDNNDILTFEISQKPLKSSYKWKNLFESKIAITQDELFKFRDSKLIKWKIEFISANDQIIGYSGNSYYQGEDFNKVVQSLANEYINLVRNEIEDYSPLINRSIEDQINDSKKEECFVYLMIDTSNNFYKIGISNFPVYREKTLLGNRPTIELLAAKKFPSRKIAESIEKALHSSFAEKRIRGEWFELNDEEVAEIIKTLS